ncbi:MAG: DUF4157 domain-containing protein [Myxococcales bacterium]|nr:DUF4157 domain-containing protein [Myxococcales bacterium]
MDYKDRGNVQQPGVAGSGESTTHRAPAAGPGKRTLTMGVAPASAPIQRKQDNAGSMVAEHELPEEIQETAKSGQPLPDDVRRKMEHAFSADFSAVRIHEGLQAQAVGALAFTRGADIFFAPGQYRPTTTRGQELLGHELAHVKQQAGGAVSQTGKAGGTPINDNPSLERAADEQGIKAAKTPDPLAAGASDREAGARDAGTPDRAAMVAATGSTEEQKPAAGTVTPGKVAGAAASKKIVRIAWTMDDGPTKVTGDMTKKLNGIPATWYVMRNQIEAGGKPAAKLATLKAAQDGGSEIAIHGLHKTESHLAWFPSKAKPSYPSIETALADLEAFCVQLRGVKINPKFVRLPYGELTEMTHMLDKLGMNDAKLRDTVARKILKGESVATDGASAKAAQDAWNKFVAKIAALGLHNWGGAGASSPEISVQSWEAESSGTGLTDDVTSSHGGKVDAKAGKFERLADNVKEGAPRSLVILAHDTAAKNADEVGNDIARIESYATSKQVRLEYYTMSQLFELARGKKP